jgi:hypothetical protein
MNDTVFYVTDKGLNPKWVVSFDDNLKLSMYVQLYSWELMRELSKAISSNSSIENTEMVKLTDNKHKITAVYETELYIFFTMTEIIQLAIHRGKQPPEPYIIYFDKRTGKTTRINKGFVDDLLGMDYFYPLLGVYDEKLITYIWPFELLDYIKGCKEKGREVNPQLMALSKKLDPDDNPVLILAHLKNN